MYHDREVVIVSACRTPIGNFMGSLSDVHPSILGATVLSKALLKIGLTPDQVDEVILGCVLDAGFGQNISRQVSIKAGLPVAVPAYTINMVCGSGMKAIILGAQSIRLGDAEVVAVGGVESMSQAAYILPGARKGLRMGAVQFLDSMITDGLTDVFSNNHMGMTAEAIAEKYGVTRQDQDELACASQNKAEAAIKSGRFTDEIVPITIPQRKGDPVVVAQDEFPRFGTTLEALTKLKPAFKPDGTVTAGNTSGINDGAAVTILMSKAKAEALSLKPLAIIRSYGTSGVEPALMGMGPVPATRQALKRADLSVEDMDLIEGNEAFAAQSVAVGRELGFPTGEIECQWRCNCSWSSHRSFRGADRRYAVARNAKTQLSPGISNPLHWGRNGHSHDIRTPERMRSTNP